MLTTDEKKFVVYWERNRKSEKSFLQQFRFVIPIALISGVAILLNFFTGWYKRANMVANNQFSPMVLIVGIIVISVFCSIFYKRHRWEMNEQRYLELMMKKPSAIKKTEEEKSNLERS